MTMNCQTIQNRILQLTDPRKVPSALRSHLDECPACAAWWARAVRLEGLLAVLPAPAPPADKKSDLIDELTSAGPVIKSIPRVESRPSRLAVVAARIGYARIAGLAAAVMLALGGWWVVTRPGGGKEQMADAHQPHPLLDKLVGRSMSLAKADTPKQRLELLGEMATDLHAETRTLAQVANPDELHTLARLFDSVVMRGVVKQADNNARSHAIPPAEKAELYRKLVDQLGAAGREAERVSREVAPASQPALKQIADTAKNGQQKLRDIIAREGV